MVRGRFRACLEIGLELRLHLIPHLLIDDGSVLARVGCFLMSDLAQINPVVQNVVKSTPREN